MRRTGIYSGVVAGLTAFLLWIPSVPSAESPLASFDQMMVQFVQNNNVPGASLAVTDQGRLVFAQGYGWADVEKRQPVLPESLFRIASLSKPLTAVAVLQLVEQGRLALSDRVFELLGHLPFPAGSAGDQRLAEITVLQLLQHRGGWDREQSFDPMFRSVPFARELGQPPPADTHAIIRCMLRRELDFPPGQRYAYSNFGYCLLGRVIERVTGVGYEDYVRQHVLAPLGIHTMRLGRTRRCDRCDGEVRYYAAGTGPSVFAEDQGQQVPRPYGSWCLEAMDAHGGWIASAVDLVRFASAFDDPEHCHVLDAESIRQMFSRPPGAAGTDDKGSPKPVYYGCGWQVRVLPSGKQNQWHTGSLSGTASLLVRRHDGRNWAVLFNTRSTPDGRYLAGIIDPLVHQAANRVKSWPDVDLFQAETDPTAVDRNAESEPQPRRD